MQANERSEQLIQGLLLLARSDRGLTSREPVRLEKVVGTVLATSTQLAAQHQVTLTTQTVPLGPVVVVMPLVLGEDFSGVCLVEDQDVVADRGF